jgi:hypothetical protein
VYPRDQLTPRLAKVPLAIGAVQRHNACPRLSQRRCGSKIRRYAQLAIHVPLLNTDDWQVGVLANGRYVFRAVDAQPTHACSGHGSRNASDGVCILQRIGWSGLARAHQASFKLFLDGCHFLYT